MLLLDTAVVPRDVRVDAFRAAMGQASVPCRIDHEDPAGGVRARMHLWPFGPANLFTADSSGFRLVRTARHVRMEGTPVVALAVQARGAGRFSQFGADSLVGTGGPDAERPHRAVLVLVERLGWVARVPGALRPC